MCANNFSCIYYSCRYCKSAKMFRSRKSLEKHVLQQPCDQNANLIQTHTQQHCLAVGNLSQPCLRPKNPQPGSFTMPRSAFRPFPSNSRMPTVCVNLSSSEPNESQCQPSVPVLQHPNYVQPIISLFFVPSPIKVHHFPNHLNPYLQKRSIASL